MIKLLIGIICAFTGGMLVAVPVGLGVNGRLSVLFAIPTAIIFIGGLIFCAWLFFAPGAMFYVSPRS